MDKPRVLLIDPDREFAYSLYNFFSMQEYEFVHDPNGTEGLATTQSMHIDCVLLSRKLPDMSGLSLLIRLCETFAKTIILLGNEGDDENFMLNALDVGADDYLKKPFSYNKLFARARDIIRRYDLPKASFEPGIVTIGDLRMDRPRHIITLHGQGIYLTPKEFDLLFALVCDAGKVFGREELLTKVWGKDGVVYDRVVDTFIAGLRRKLEGYGSKLQISTVYGVGYKLDPEQEKEQVRAEIV